MLLWLISNAEKSHTSKNAAMKSTHYKDLLMEAHDKGSSLHLGSQQGIQETNSSSSLLSTPKPWPGGKGSEFLAWGSEDRE